MRNAITVSILTAVLALCAAAAIAGPPLSGTYKSSDGDFQEGVESVRWEIDGVGPPQYFGVDGFVGDFNTLFAYSWDGAAIFGQHWTISCPMAVSVIELSNTVIGGNGHLIYWITYAGGTIELGGTGPWGNGDPVYTGAITTYTEFRTVQIAGGVKVGSVSDHSVTANINGYTTSCITWGIGNGAWRNEGAVVPAPYPAFRDATCLAKPATGHWSDIRDLTISVTGCAVSTEESSWGRVKSMYKD